MYNATVYGKKRAIRITDIPAEFIEDLDFDPPAKDFAYMPTEELFPDETPSKPVPEPDPVLQDFTVYVTIAVAAAAAFAAYVAVPAFRKDC